MIACEWPNKGITNSWEFPATAAGLLNQATRREQSLKARASSRLFSIRKWPQASRLSLRPSSSTGQPAPAPAYQGGQVQYAGPAPAAAGPMPTPQGVTPLQAPPGQATPLRVQGQQQQQADSGSGFWSTLKEIFASPTTVGPAQNPRSMFDGRGKGRYSDGM